MHAVLLNDVFSCNNIMWQNVTMEAFTHTDKSKKNRKVDRKSKNYETILFASVHTHGKFHTEK